MLTQIYGSAVYGIDALRITIEVNIDKGIGYHLVGLPDNAVKESNYRIAAALQHSGYKLPGKKITINMAPADIRKEGAAYDLPIALGILLASGQINSEGIENVMMMGELSLDGSIRSIKGALSMALQAKKEGIQHLLIPSKNAKEAAIVDGISVYGVSNIKEVIDFLKDPNAATSTTAELEQHVNSAHPKLDFSDVKGQDSIKRCMEIAAAGGHNIILIGPPGSGKTMLAKRLPSILPPMTLDESLETTKIHSVVGRIKEGVITERPFRAPHHTISDVALVGGGSYPQPGEISLAHNGVLFLDELPEFKRGVLEVMRQPLEDREITISRAKFSITYPASFMLVASMNPSPGGYFHDESHYGSKNETQRYLSKISGPLLDRIDMHVEVTPVPFERLTQKTKSTSSTTMRDRVLNARKVQLIRFEQDKNIFYNAQMYGKMLQRYCVLNSTTMDMLKEAMNRLSLSARAFDRILKVARTIADLGTCTHVEDQHISEAIQYRNLDREGWLG